MVKNESIFIAIIVFALASLSRCSSPGPSEGVTKKEASVVEAPPAVRKAIRETPGLEPSRAAIEGPSSRHSAKMVFDSKRNTMVLFGGFLASGLGYPRDTIEWDGVGCVRVEVESPRPRANHAMAFDSARGETVLFGGGIQTLSVSTWLWNGRTWLDARVDGPGARADPGMVYDSKRERAVLFGGVKGDIASRGEFGETWEWDGSRWEMVSNVGPATRYGHAMAYDEKRGKTVLFGGDSPTGLLNDTWEWDGREWIQVESLGPEARFYHGMAYDFNAQKVLLFGGKGKIVEGRHVDLGDTWEWDGQSWRKIGSASRPKMGHLAMAFDGTRNKVIIFGGIDNNLDVYGLWEWNGRRWQQAAF